jgi:hypothetical protein
MRSLSHRGGPFCLGQTFIFTGVVKMIAFFEIEQKETLCNCDEFWLLRCYSGIS